MRVFASFHVKGGVGKTTSAVNLAFLSAREGHRTLLWDLDSQGAASFFLRTKPRVQKSGRLLASGEVELGELVRSSDYEDLDVVPADSSLRRLEPRLGGETRRLARLVEQLDGKYEHVFLDCPPGLTLVAENVFEAADVVLTPTIPTPLALRALAQLVKFLNSREDRRYRVLPFFGLVDRRKSLHRETCDWVRAQPLNFLRTEIPYSSTVEQMGVRRAPLASFAPASDAAIAYEELWSELCERMDKKRDQNADSMLASPRKLVREQAEMWQAARRAT